MIDAPRSEKKKLLHRLVTALSDVTAACHACQLVQRKVNDIGDPLYHPLLDAIVVSYARPFTKNKPLGALPAKYAPIDDRVLLATHQEILDMRHKFVAHSDAVERCVQIVPPNVCWGPTAQTYIRWAVRWSGFKMQWFKVAENLCLYVGYGIEKDAKRLLDELYGSHDLPSETFDLDFTDGL